MKVIVFGGAGFLGSHVADVLSEQGYKVTVYDRNKSLYADKKQRMVSGDILDLDKVAYNIRGCNYVYDFAGIADLDDAATKPLDTVKQNIEGTVNILEGCRKANVKRFVFASTIYVYSDKGGFYRSSKQSAELYIEEYRKRYGLHYTIARYGTTYGPRSDERNSVYRYLTQALRDKKIICYSTGEEVREYIHARDAAMLSVDILFPEHEDKHVIITGHHPVKFKDFLQTIREMLGNKVEVEFKKPSRDSSHYALTPYSFIPKIGYKLTTNRYCDLGQGLLECANLVNEHLCLSEKLRKKR